MNAQVKPTQSNFFKSFFIVSILLFTFSVKGQQVIETPVAAQPASTTVESNQTIEMMTWFMGAKQTTTDSTVKESSCRKQMMANGVAPNRLLIKTFLKKASQYASNIA